jgi:hypothetical protein
MGAFEAGGRRKSMRDGPERRSPSGDRGQTLHDYVVGISVFVLTVAVVVGLLPSVVAPFADTSRSVERTQAKRVVDQLVANTSVAGSATLSNASRLESRLDGNLTELRDRYGLEDFRHVNVTLSRLNETSVVANGTGVPQTAGASAVTEEAASATRIVQVDDPASACSPACRLIVRVW